MEVARYWRFNKQRYSLIGDIDGSKSVAFPPGPNRPRFKIEDPEADGDMSAAKKVNINKNYVVFQRSVPLDVK